MKKSFILSIILILGMALSGCGDDAGGSKNEAGKKGEVTVYTTVYPLHYFAERIGGEYVDVKSIYPPGADEHSFEPSQKDMVALADSDLFVYIGLGLEGFVEKAETTLKNEHVTMIAAAEGIDLESAAHEGEKTEDGHGHEETESHSAESDSDDGGHGHADVDPHVWLDPVYSKELAESIKNALAEKKPELKDEFEKNYTALAAELDELNGKFEQAAKEAHHKEIIVSHAAFGYWESRYGIEQHAIGGLSTTSEPSQKDMETIISTIKKEKIKHILVEQNVSSKLSETVKNETGASFLPIHNLSTLTDENISEKDTYFTIMDQNIETLKKAMAE